MHLKRANFVAKLLKSTDLNPGADEYADHGWTRLGEPIWTTECVPQNISSILCESTTEIDDDDEFDERSSNSYDEGDDEFEELEDYS